jgi:triosephosphate isomerase (TIM)
MILINLKTYQQGKDVFNLAKIIEKSNKDVILCAQATDINNLSRNTKLTIYAQHVDNKSQGRNNGFVIPEAVKANGAKGSLINHSENQIPKKDIKELIEKCRKLGLKSIVCAITLTDVLTIKKMKPYAIAYEDPQLIATGNSISRYKSDDLKRFVNLLKGSNIIPICGAGVSNKQDIIAAKKLGCKGVLIASAIAKKPNEKKIKEILS